jgi:hypothetical protein
LKATDGLAPGTPAAFEVAFGTGWLVELLEAYSFDPHVVHPSWYKAIASARLENDKFYIWRAAGTGSRWPRCVTAKALLAGRAEGHVRPAALRVREVDARRIGHLFPARPVPEGAGDDRLALERVLVWRAANLAAALVPADDGGDGD